METTTHSSTVEAAARKLYNGPEGEFSMMAANSWNGTDLHASSGETLRMFTTDSGEGDHRIITLSRNGVVSKLATLSNNVSAESLATIAWELWMDR